MRVQTTGFVIIFLFHRLVARDNVAFHYTSMLPFATSFPIVLYLVNGYLVHGSTISHSSEQLAFYTHHTFLSIRPDPFSSLFRSLYS